VPAVFNGFGGGQRFAELSTAPHVPGGFLAVLVPYQDSWYIPGAFLVHSWANIQGFLIYSWYIPGTFLVAGCTIIFQLIRPSMPVYGVFPYALLISHRLKYSQIKNKYIY
jgi:hypothetical protein